MSHFEQRMLERKQREAEEYRKMLGEKAAVADVQLYPVTFTANILGTSVENSKETFGILYEILESFEDLKNVSGQLHSAVEDV